MTVADTPRFRFCGYCGEPPWPQLLISRPLSAIEMAAAAEIDAPTQRLEA